MIGSGPFIISDDSDFFQKKLQKNLLKGENKFGVIKEKRLYLYKQNTNTMKEFIYVLTNSPLHEQTMMIVWGVSVLTFYSVLVYGVGGLVFQNLKKIVK